MNERIKEGCTLFADLIEAVPEAFCKEAYAKDEHGTCLAAGYAEADEAVRHPSAVSFCMVGGVMAAARLRYDTVRNYLGEFTGWETPEQFNNFNSREAVISKLREAAL